MVRLNVLLTSYNRRDKTVRSLSSLFDQIATVPVHVDVILVDDASTDGTEQCIRDQFPQVTVLRGDGSLFWSGGMRKAFAKALERRPDYVLWLNDDTSLFRDAIDRLLKASFKVRTAGHVNAIIVGATRDSRTHKLSYSGWRRVSLFNPAKWEKVEPSDIPVQCDTMNGNCVLIPRCVAEMIGNIDPAFTHGMGDLDYGFRARKAGCTIWLAEGYIGVCDLNSEKQTWIDSSLPLLRRWKLMLGPKGLPPREWLLFTYRHTGWLWPILWANPYIKLWIKGAWHRLVSK